MTEALTALRSVCVCVLCVWCVCSHRRTAHHLFRFVTRFLALFTTLFPPSLSRATPPLLFASAKHAGAACGCSALVSFHSLSSLSLSSYHAFEVLR